MERIQELADPVVTAIGEDLRERVHEIRRRTAWDAAVAAAIVVSLVCLIASFTAAAAGRSLTFSTSAPVAFAVLALLLLLLSSLNDRTKKAEWLQVAAFAESVMRRMHSNQARHDALTATYNRAALADFGENLIARSLRQKAPVALVIFDLDHFHELNSRHGHLEGDNALIDFAHILRSSTRGSDVVARYGGDEFVLLLPDTPSGFVAPVIRRVQDRVDERNSRIGSRLRLSFTSGAAGFHEGMTFAQWFEAADSELLARKANRGESRERAVVS